MAIWRGGSERNRARPYNAVIAERVSDGVGCSSAAAGAGNSLRPPGWAPLVDVLLSAGLVCAFPGVSWSSCPSPGSICAEYDRSGLVFLADVVSVQPEGGPTRSGVVSAVTFRVLESFKGESRRPGHAVGRPIFRGVLLCEGARVLVYARQSGTAWSTA